MSSDLDPVNSGLAIFTLISTLSGGSPPTDTSRRFNAAAFSFESGETDVWWGSRIGVHMQYRRGEKTRMKENRVATVAGEKWIMVEGRWWDKTIEK